jgi:hypothetical protein
VEQKSKKSSRKDRDKEAKGQPGVWKMKTYTWKEAFEDACEGAETLAVSRASWRPIETKTISNRISKATHWILNTNL